MACVDLFVGVCCLDMLLVAAVAAGLCLFGAVLLIVQFRLLVFTLLAPVVVVWFDCFRYAFWFGVCLCSCSLC